MEIRAIHHVSLPVSNLERSREFYGTFLGLTEIGRPPSDFPGAWYLLGNGQLHLIAYDDSTFRKSKGIDAQDIHLALRVNSYREAQQVLRSKGYRPDADEESKRTIEYPEGTAGWPQLYVMDPDRNIIELNAEELNAES